MRCVIFVPNAAVATRAGTPGGLSLLERQLKQLRALAAPPPLLLVADGVAVPPPSATLPYGEMICVGRVPHLFAALTAAARRLPDAFMFCAADHVIDLRVLRTLREPGACTVVVDGDGRRLPIGRATNADVRSHGNRLADVARPLRVTDLDPYVSELRGDAAPYAAPVRDTAEREAAWALLLDGVQKRTLDVPGQYFDTPFENALVRRLAPTPVTPNQITVLTTVVAGITGVLFLHGWLRVGLVLALTVGVLDGVDGKLARLKLATSRLGALEHVTDFFYENFWWLALATHFAAADGLHLWHAGIVLVACDLLDNLVYAAVSARTGRMLDELSPFDRRFRGIAGRRNVYVTICAPGFLLGHGAGAFLAAACWAGITVTVHVVRLLMLLRAPRATRDAATPAFQLPEIESASRVLVQEK
jgi:phosphatidylglycerophosphate synthase